MIVRKHRVSADDAHCASKIPLADIAQPEVRKPDSPSNRKPRRGKNRKIRLSMVYDMDNIRAADVEARRNKAGNYGIRKFDIKREDNLIAIRDSIRDGTYKTMEPDFEERFCDKKVRVLSKVHYPYHVAHHALMRVIMPVLQKSYYYESAASIKGRGLHYAAKHVRKWIDLHSKQPLYWVQIDFEKFYHHVVRQKVYDRLCRTFNDKGIRWMLHDVLWALGNHNGLGPSDGTRGLGIGLYPIQPIVNYYLNDLNRQVARMIGFYSIYCDNMLMIDNDPKRLWKAVEFVKQFAAEELEQPLHQNIGIQRIDDVHPVDYVGYLFYTDHTLVRKETKYRFKRKFKQTINNEDKHRSVMASYKGWLERCNGLTLWQNITGMKRFSELNIEHGTTMRDGKRFFDVQMVSASFLVNREITVKDIEEDVQTKNGNGRMCVLVEENGTEKKFLTNNPRLKDTLLQVREADEFPFVAFLRSRNIQGNKIDYYFE